MKLAKLGTSLLVLCLTLVSMPLVGAHSAGGGIQGKVTDPKGAVVVGAAVTVTDPVTNQTFTAVTDQQGKFKVEGLAAGVYSVTVSAQGFDEGRRGQVKVTDGAVATADIKLEIAPVEAALTVKSAGPPPNSDPIYQELRQMGRGPANSQATSTNTGNTSTTTGNREA